MKFDHPTSFAQVVDSASSHDFLDFKLSSDDSIMDVMASINNPKDEVTHQSSFPDLEQPRVNMMSSSSGLGEFVETPSKIPNLDPFLPRLYFLELTVKFFSPPSIEDLRFVPPSCLDGHHQGATISHETTHNKYL